MVVEETFREVFRAYHGVEAWFGKWAQSSEQDSD
jgi:hypothetical protein